MSVIRSAAALVLATASIAAPAAARDDAKQVARPAVIADVYACQAIADNAQRLACFDAAAAAMRNAEESRTVIFADQEQVKKARKGLFGFGNIRLGLFGDDDDASDGEAQLEEMTGKLKAVGQLKGGKIYFVLDDGARWEQVDTAQIRLRDLKAETATIKRAAMGGFVAQLGDGRFFAAKRVQ